MERIRFHVFFKISFNRLLRLAKFQPNKEKKKKIVQGIKPAANVMKLLPNTILMPQIIEYPYPRVFLEAFHALIAALFHTTGTGSGAVKNAWA